MKFFPFLLLVFHLFLGNAPAETDSLITQQQEKVYLEQDSIFLENNEIIVIINNEACFVESLYKDRGGFFVILNRKDQFCPNGHPRECPWCGGCRAWCMYRCLCTWQQ